MFQCATSSWWPSCVTPCCVLDCGREKFGRQAGRQGAIPRHNYDGLSSQDTLSNAAELFIVLHMDPMSDVSMCNQLLVAQLYHPMPCFGLQLGKFGTGRELNQDKIDGPSSKNTVARSF
jgi:hypothetical protein